MNVEKTNDFWGEFTCVIFLTYFSSNHWQQVFKNVINVSFIRNDGCIFATVNTGASEALAGMSTRCARKAKKAAVVT